MATRLPASVSFHPSISSSTRHLSVRTDPIFFVRAPSLLPLPRSRFVMASPSANQGPPKDVPSAVRALLLATKRLQDTLRRWAVRSATEDDVSDVYVEIGNEFNTTMNAFADHGVDLRSVDLSPAIIDLRFCFRA